MRLLTLFAATILLTSCAVKRYPLKGTYSKPPISEMTDKSEELVWTHLIDFISETGLSIKLIDKSSGFLVMDDYSFAGVHTIEVKGKPKDPKAFLVTSSYRSPATGKPTGPARIIGNFNVRVKRTENGTLINVNITNLRAFDTYGTKTGLGFVETNYQIRTTGEFERLLINYVK